MQRPPTLFDMNVMNEIWIKTVGKNQLIRVLCAMDFIFTGRTKDQASCSGLLIYFNQN